MVSFGNQEVNTTGPQGKRVNGQLWESGQDDTRLKSALDASFSTPLVEQLF